MGRFVLILLTIGFILWATPARTQSVIPVPQKVVPTAGIFRFDTATKYDIAVAKGVVCSDLADYIAALPWNLQQATGKIKTNVVRIRLAAKNKDITSDEGYILTITPTSVDIIALSETGAFYAVQTLLQLAAEGGKTTSEVACQTVIDNPRFGYRGLMLDTSRNFLPKNYILKQLDAMARFKLNTLHFHLTDGAGWRLEIDKYPRLTSFAAWRPYKNWYEWWSADRSYCDREHPMAHGGYYTKQDIRDIVEYARQRHITVIPEIEMPGHSEEVIAAYPELGCSGKPYADSDLCPGNEQTFEFIENVLTEVMEMFPSEYIHVGGDEAGKGGWRKCPKCQTRMEAEGFEHVDQLQSYMMHRVEVFLNSHGRRLLGWDEILEGGLAPNATVMSWRGEQGGVTAVKSGHQAVMTPGEFCYIDYSQDAPFTQPLSIGGYTPLRKVYSYDPMPEGLTAEEQKLVLGAQANLFAEYIFTETHSEYMLYPRVLAIAEATWSQMNRRNYDDFHRRAVEAVDYLRYNGYNPFDLRNEYGDRRESLSPQEHLALGKAVTYNIRWHEKYAASGASTLTDGVLGGWTYGDRKWQGFLNSDIDVTIDMDSVTDIHYIGATFMQSSGPYVWMPSKVEIFVSDDGRQYRLLHTVYNDISVKCPDLLFKRFAYVGDVAARYVRYKAYASGVDGGWLFTDEIIVN